LAGLFCVAANSLCGRAASPEVRDFARDHVVVGQAPSPMSGSLLPLSIPLIGAHGGPGSGSAGGVCGRVRTAVGVDCLMLLVRSARRATGATGAQGVKGHTGETRALGAECDTGAASTVPGSAGATDPAGPAGPTGAKAQPAALGSSVIQRSSPEPLHPQAATRRREPPQVRRPLPERRAPSCSTGGASVTQGTAVKAAVSASTPSNATTSTGDRNCDRHRHWFRLDYRVCKLRHVNRHKQHDDCGPVPNF
jgi:hypothetical protein